MNTNCIVIHGCPSDIEKTMSPETRTYDKHWIPWIKKELTTAEIRDMVLRDLSKLHPAVVRAWIAFEIMKIQKKK